MFLSSDDDLESVAAEQVGAVLLPLLGGRRHGNIVGIIAAPHAEVLVAPHVVVGQEVDLERGVLIGESREESGGGLDVLVVGIDALDEGDADAQVVAGRGQSGDVLENQLVADARQAAVQRRVHQLQVDEQELALGCHAVGDGRLGVERRVDGAVQSAAAQLAQYCQRRIGLHQRFAAADRHAAATLLHDHALLLHLGHQLVHRPLPAADLQGPRGACLGAAAAQRAAGGVSF